MKIKELDFGELTALYTIVSEICSDYARMTDMYSLASGDKLFENMPNDIKEMVNERQKFFNIRSRIKEEVKKRILEDYE